MLQTYNKSQWSPNGVKWFDIDVSGGGSNGGSAKWWPRDNGRVGDERVRLSYWGQDDPHDDGLTGGCCSSSTDVDVTHPSLPGSPTYWAQSFTMSYAIQLQPLPPNTGMSLVANVAGTTQADDAFWAENCKTIPANTQLLVLDMGAVSL